MLFSPLPLKTTTYPPNSCIHACIYGALVELDFSWSYSSKDRSDAFHTQLSDVGRGFLTPALPSTKPGVSRNGVLNTVTGKLK